MTCSDCVHLAIENKRLKAMLSRAKIEEVPLTHISPMATALALSSQQEAILSALWTAKGDAISSSALSIAMGSKSSKASIRVQICRIKDALGEGCIANRYGIGYYLTRKGMERVTKLMESTK